MPKHLHVIVLQTFISGKWMIYQTISRRKMLPSSKKKNKGGGLKGREELQANQLKFVTGKSKQIRQLKDKLIRTRKPHEFVKFC